jgi:hypothetical protein
MKRRAERGFLLVPVALTLAIVGALAYTMTRAGSMSVSAVNAAYDTEVARYLAEAGANLAKWQNEKFGCAAPVSFGTVALPGGQVVAGVLKREGGGFLNISLTATTSLGAVHVLDGYRTMTHNPFKEDVVTIYGGGNNDSTITYGVGSGQGNSSYLEASDGKSHALVKFGLPGALSNAVTISAYLTLTQFESKSTQSPRSLSVHRITRDWSGGPTWDAPWTTPGGDYAPVPTATVPIAGNGDYTWRIDGLVDGWNKNTFDNQGVLFKPSGLLDAHFYSLDTSSNRPKLVVRYYPHC